MLELKRVLIDMLFSLYRVGVGVALAIIVSVFMSWIRFNLPLRFQRNLIIRFLFDAPKFPPPIAWIPLVVLVAGVSEISAISIVFIGAFPPLFTALYDGLEKFPMRFLNLAGSFELSKGERFKLLYSRALLPNFFTALKTATGMGWMSVIAAEMISGESGLGYGIGLARIYLRYDFIILYMVLMAIIGQALFLVIDFLRAKFVPWEKVAR